MRAPIRTCIALLLVAGATRALADDVAAPSALVIDTDLGIDDAVAVALALQHHDAQVVSLVATEGVAGEARTRLAWRLLDFFNRHDVRLTSAPQAVAHPPAPPFRGFAEAALDRSLPLAAGMPATAPFAPQVYAAERGRTTVLALGPLTGLAAALRAEPGLAERIARVVIAGPADPAKNWNLRFDRDAFEVVRASRVPLLFVVPDGEARKPAAWRDEQCSSLRGTTLAAAFLDTLFADTTRREHWLMGMPAFHDELAFLYWAEPDLFVAGDAGMVSAADGRRIEASFERAVAILRLRRPRVALAEAPLPDAVFAPDVGARRAAIVAKNGEEEWFAELLTQEVHGHLGAYSILGAKMGIRAAELLNAPLHGMRIVSQTPDEQPIGCLDDGLILATGSTPGRRLYRHEPGPAGAVQATFEYNDRRLVLRLADSYRERIGAAIGALLARHSLDDPAYWQGVRQLGLDMWENWPRQDLFEVVR